MSPMLMADILVTVHVAFVAFVLLSLPLILLGGALGWGWVRNFWFRVIHLVSIAFGAGGGVGATVYAWSDEEAAWKEEEARWWVECPLTTWERDYRRTYSTRERGFEILTD